MKKLFTTFKTLSASEKIKFVLLVPLVCLVNLLDTVIDVLAVIVDAVVHFIKRRWLEVSALILVILVIAIPVTIAVHVDRTVPRFRGDTQAQAEKYVYKNCHEMANNFIVAEDGHVRGYVRADDKNIDRLIVVISEYRFSDKDLLISWLSEFKSGDYSNAVGFHNYCWEELDGEVGYAVSLKKQYK